MAEIVLSSRNKLNPLKISLLDLYLWTLSSHSNETINKVAFSYYFWTEKTDTEKKETHAWLKKQKQKLFLRQS